MIRIGAKILYFMILMMHVYICAYEAITGRYFWTQRDFYPVLISGLVLVALSRQFYKWLDKRAADQKPRPYRA